MIMQERRRVLYNILTQEDIPSSAVELTSNNYTKVSGNVLYIPRNGYIGTSYSYSNAYRTDNIDLDFSGYPNIIKINNVSFDVNSEYCPYLQNGGYNYIVLGGNDGTSMYSNSISVRHSKYSGGTIYTLEGIVSGSSLLLPAVLDNEDIIYYDVIKLDKNVSISSLGTNVLSKHPPIYIYTE